MIERDLDRDAREERGDNFVATLSLNDVPHLKLINNEFCVLNSCHIKDNNMFNTHAQQQHLTSCRNQKTDQFVHWILDDAQFHAAGFQGRNEIQSDVEPLEVHNASGFTVLEMS